MKASHGNFIDSPEYRGRVERALSIRELLALHDDPNYEEMMHEYNVEKERLGHLPGDAGGGEAGGGGARV